MGKGHLCFASSRDDRPPTYLCGLSTDDARTPAFRRKTRTGRRFTRKHCGNCVRVARAYGWRIDHFMSGRPDPARIALEVED